MSDTWKEARRMKYNIRTHEIPVDLAIIEQALTEADPAALLDFDKAASLLRFSSCLNGPELLALMAQAGFPVADSALEDVPSECCGGCGG
jgi:hypothetical protein